MLKQSRLTPLLLLPIGLFLASFITFVSHDARIAPFSISKICAKTAAIVKNSISLNQYIVFNKYWECQ